MQCDSSLNGQNHNSIILYTNVVFVCGCPPDVVVPSFFMSVASYIERSRKNSIIQIVSHAINETFCFQFTHVCEHICSWCYHYRHVGHINHYPVAWVLVHETISWATGLYVFTSMPFELLCEILNLWLNTDPFIRQNARALFTFIWTHVQLCMLS